MNKKALIAIMLILCMLSMSIYFVVPVDAQYAENNDDEGPLCFTAEEDNSTVEYEIEGGGVQPMSIQIQTSTDGINWDNWAENTLITLQKVGDCIYVRNIESTLSNEENYLHFVMDSGEIVASGNVNSMINYGVLSEYCYYRMFDECRSLTTAPILPATTLASNCYHNMFLNCTLLTIAPTLPATTLTPHCYSGMFSDCTLLTIAPALPATILTEYCYNEMFSRCTSLTMAPALPATILANYCYQDMFVECTSLTMAPALPATILANYCYNKMFFGCTSLTMAPALPAMILTEYCYYEMFSGCTSLNTILCSATETGAENCTTRWVTDILNEGTFYTHDETVWDGKEDNDGIPNNWSVLSSYTAIIFDSMGGTIYKGENPFQNFMIAEDGKLTELPVAQLTNWKFEGWYDSSIGGNKIELDREYKKEADTIIYAHWRTNMLIFDYNGGTGGPFFVNGVGSVIIPSEVPTFEGHKFLGWKEDGNEKIYNPGDEYVFVDDKDAVLHAVWDGISPGPEPEPEPGIIEIINNPNLIFMVGAIVVAITLLAVAYFIVKKR